MTKGKVIWSQYNILRGHGVVIAGSSQVEAHNLWITCRSS